MVLDELTPEHVTGIAISRGKKTIYFHLKKFFRGTRFTCKPFLKSLAEKYQEGDVACVSGKVSFLYFLTWFFVILNCSMRR